MSLLAPLYLLGLLALLLPWLLHRFSHHEPPEKAFPTTRFLEPTKPPATSKRSLRYWLLFVLRLLFLVALCLLFAQPWLRSSNDAANSEAVQLVVVDNSFSMRALNHWKLAKDAVDTVLSELPDDDAVQLFSYAGQLASHTDIVTDRSLVKTALNQIEPGFESADFGEMMRRLNKVAGDIDKPVVATFITDGQRANLPQQMNALLANRLQAFNIVSVIGDSSDSGTTPLNYSLRAEARTEDSVTARVSVRVSASETALAVDEASLSTVKTVHVSLQGRVLGTQDVSLDAGESKTIHFEQINLPSEPDALVNVSFAQPDFLNDDDAVDVPVRGLSSTEITLTNIGQEPTEQARVFISTALEANGNARIELLDASAALAPSVRHAIVFVDNLTDVPDEVTRFVMAGGNALLLPVEQKIPSGATASSSSSTVGRIDLAHALSLGDINWFETHFYSMPVLQTTAEDQILMSLNTGEPILVERIVGDRGRMLLLNDALDGLNSDLPLQPAFVLLMTQIVEYFSANNALPIELEVGQDLFLPANSQLLSPAAEPLLALSQLGTANSVRIETPGVYSVLAASTTESVSVVLNSGESNLLALSAAELDAWESRHNAKVLVSDADTDDGEPSSEVSSEVSRNVATTDDMGYKFTLWHWLLPVVLVLLAIESLYANRMLWVRRDGL